MRILFYSRGVEQLGVEYVMAYARSRGHEVDLLFDRGLDNNLYYRARLLRAFNRTGRIIDRAVAFKPDLVAFAAVTNVYPFALDLAQRLKKKLDVPFVFGGHHATALPRHVLEAPEVDYAIRGEGEEPLAELCEALEGKRPIESVRNLAYRKDGEVRMNPLRPLYHDLDALPFPSRDEFYRAGAFRELMLLITARGCPFKCTYCINNFYREKFYKEIDGPVRPVRRRSPGNVIAEIHDLKSRFPLRHIFFCDEVFVVQKPWLHEFLDRFRTEHADVTFSFQYHHQFIDEDIARRIAAAGGQFAQGAIETANERLRKDILKRHDTDEGILRAMRILKGAGIKTSTSAIFGIPFETPASRWETVDLVERSQPDMINTYLMYPFPGTEIADIALAGGFLSEDGYAALKDGRSSYHQDSLFQNMDLDNAATMAKLLPLYIKGPRRLRPLVRWLMHRRIPRLSHFTYVVTSPFLYSGWITAWIKNLIRMFFLSVARREVPASAAALKAEGQP